MLIPDLQLNVTIATGLLSNLIPDGQITVSESSAQGGNRKQIVVDFNQGGGLYARDLATIFTWPTNSDTILYTWQPTLLAQPEDIYNRASDWLDGGYPGAKFIQGVIIEAATFGNAKSFGLQSADDSTIYPLNEVPATFTNHSKKAFSCVAPFIAHSARVVSSDGVQWQLWDAQIVFQPFPELTQLWQTEKTSLGMTGWGHIRELNIPYIAANPATLVLAFDNGATQTIALPASATQSKAKVTPQFNKFKLVSFAVSAIGGVRVFQEDIEVKCRPWGSSGPYGVLKPFGGKSAPGADV